MASGSRFTVIVQSMILALTMSPHLASAQGTPRSTRSPGTPQPAASPTTDDPVITRTEKLFPTGDRATSVILLERTAPVEVRRGQSFNYEITLTNLTRGDLGEVTLTELLPKSFKAETVNPEPTRREGEAAIWRYEGFPGGGRTVIRVLGSTDHPDELTWCATVTFGTKLCATTKTVEPKLVLTKTAPAEVLICDTIPIKLVVTNTGTGTVQGVRVTDNLPRDWQGSDGKNTVAFEAGSLRPGESREFSFQARSAGTGNFVNEATASALGGFTAKASTETVVRQPVLAVSKTGPEVRFIGRPAEYKLTVSNTGDTAARDIMLVDTVSGVGEFLRASDNGQYANGKVTWALGTLAPGASRSVDVAFVGRKAGIIRDDAVATAYCASARASASTQVQGVAAILLEVVDVADPIEVGAAETYIITVVNQGTADDRNIRVTCTLPPEEEYISAEGPTTFKADGKTVTFDPLPSLAPKAKAVYRVVVKGTKVEDARFKTQLTSDMLNTPVEETESTHIY
ncbi:MAG: DUF11 domain-containing protein [Phycisphaerae bacterium]|nr:DUF11 domain-containing protein [Phycisphaerae bacterium]